MKRFAFLTFTLLVILSIQSIAHAQAVGLLDGTQWEVVLFEYDSETKEWLGTYPAVFSFQEGMFGFVFGELDASTSYTSFMLPLSIAWGANLYVEGDPGVNYWFNSKVGKKLQYMTGTIDTDMGSFFNFVAIRVPLPPASE